MGSADASEKLVARRWWGVVPLRQSRWVLLLTVRTLVEQPYAPRETSWEMTAFCAVLAEKAASRSGDCAASTGQHHATAVSDSRPTHKPFDVEVEGALGAFDGTCDALSEGTAVVLDRAVGVTASRCSSQRTTASFGSLAAVAACGYERKSQRSYCPRHEGCEKGAPFASRRMSGTLAASSRASNGSAGGS